jgi:diamine N-acetyltransferase
LPTIRARVASAAVELRRFYVAPTRHGSGLADMLMARAVAIAQPRGRALWLSVWEEAPRAVGFYRRNGFEVAGRATFFVGDDAKDDWVMCRAL